MTVAAASRLLDEAASEQSIAEADRPPSPLLPRSPAPEDAPRGTSFSADSLRPARVGAPTSIERLDWVRGHLARIDRRGLTAAERQEMLRLLKLIGDDVASLTTALTTALKSAEAPASDG